MIQNSFSKWILSYKYRFLLIPLSIILLIISRYYLNYEGRDHDNMIWEVFFNVFGMIYAVIAGLILVEEFKRYGDLHEDLELELNAMQDIRDYLVYLDEDPDEDAKDSKSQIMIKKGVKKALLTYAYSLMTSDWMGMRSRCRNLDSDTSKELIGLINSVNKLKINNDSDRIGLEQIMLKVSEITTLRTQRIALAQKTIPSQLSALINSMGVILVFGIILLNVDSLWLHTMLTAISSSVILIIYLLFEDLANPFDGQWNISKKGFINFSRRIFRNLKNDNIVDEKYINDIGKNYKKGISQEDEKDGYILVNFLEKEIIK